MNFSEKINEIKKNAKKRKFTQSWDLILNIKALNLKKPENRLNTEFTLPEGRGKDLKIAVFADSMITDAKKFADLAVGKAEITGLKKNKKKLKDIVNNYDWYFAEAPLMVIVAKELGAILGPKNKTPRPIPPKIDLEGFLKAAKKKIRITLKDSPVIHVSIGTESMEDEKIAKNAEAVYNFVKEKLPKGQHNIKSVYIKLTMSKPVRVE